MSQATVLFPNPTTRDRENCLEEGRIVDGTVIRIEDTTLTVRSGDLSVTAKRAAGCLLEPAIGDRVVLAPLGEEVFVLSVLERDPDVPAVIGAGPDLSVKAQRVSVQGSESVKVLAPDVRVDAMRGTFAMRAIEVMGDRFEGNIDTVRMLAKKVDSLADRVRQRFKRSYRYVEGLDQTRAGNIDQRATGAFHAHSANTAITAELLVKIDGEQVHLG